jgi:predicted MPP superfamily phosphohydrolase
MWASVRAVIGSRGRQAARAALLLLCAAVLLPLACATGPRPIVLTSHPPPEGERPFAAVGDLQRTSLLETVFLLRESNDRERERVVRELAQVRPAFVVSLGDLVFDGASGGQWGELDTLVAPLREADIPVLPVLGNHEYWGRNSRGLRNYFQRFPVLQERHWYCFTQGRLGLVFLDTNFEELSAAQRQAQLAWLDQTLAAFEADGSVRAVLLLGHHPPYTNSTATEDECPVKDHVVPRVHHFRKVLGYVSGHVHSYERFERLGKLFLVSGGGGGPRVTLATGEDRRHTDDRYTPAQAEPSEKRAFHFLLFRPGPEGLEVEARGLEKGGDAFSTLERFMLPWPAPGGSGTGPKDCLVPR